VKTGYWLETY